MQTSAVFEFFGDATNSAAALQSISGGTHQTANICHFCHKCTTFFFIFYYLLSQVYYFTFLFFMILSQVDSLIFYCYIFYHK